MARNTNLDSVLFPVALRNVYYETRQRDPNGETYAKHLVPRQRVVVNAELDSPIAIVGQDYRLIKNQEAIAFAEQCFKAFFKTTSANEIQVFNVIAPQSGSFCHIDFIHNGYEVNIWKSETWLPFIRLTNSYNRSRALRFDVGFVRKLCDNGVIYEQETISFRLNHTKKDKGLEAQFFVGTDKIEKLKAQFIAQMQTLAESGVPEHLILPLVCMALQIDFDLESQDEKKRAKEHERLGAFRQDFDSLKTKYLNELGVSAYAVVNIVSDLASRPLFATAPSMVTNTLQRRAGNWISDFTKAIKTDGFDWENYLDGWMHLAGQTQLSLFAN